MRIHQLSDSERESIPESVKIDQMLIYHFNNRIKLAGLRQRKLTLALVFLVGVIFQALGYAVEMHSSEGDTFHSENIGQAPDITDTDPANRLWYLVHEDYDDLPVEKLRQAWHDRVPEIRTKALTKMGADTRLISAIPEKTRRLMSDPKVRNELKRLITEFPDDGKLISNVISLFRGYQEEGIQLAFENRSHREFVVQFTAVKFLAAYQLANPIKVSSPQQFANWDRWSPEEKQSIIYSLLIDKVIGAPLDATAKQIRNELDRVIVEKYSSSDVQTRRIMALTLYSRFNDDPVVEYLLKYGATDSDPAIQSVIIGRLETASFLNDFPLAFVQDILNSEDVRLRQQLAKAQLPEKYLFALPILCADADPWVVASALMNPQSDWLDSRFLKARLEILERIAASETLHHLLPSSAAVKHQLGNSGSAYTEALGTLLMSPNGLNRKWVVGALPAVEDEATMDTLKAITNDRAYYVQRAAMEVLAEFASDSARRHLESLLSQNTRHDKGSILWALGQIGMRQSWPAIVPYLYDKKAGVRSLAVDALKKIDAVDAGSQISNLLNDKENLVRIAAMEALGELGLKAFAPAIRDSLKDTDPEIQRRAIYTLEKLGYGDAEFQIANILKGSLEQKDRASWILESAAISYLKRFSTEKSALVLAETLANDSNRKVSEVIDILGKTKDKRAVPALVQIMLAKEREMSVRQSAAKALGLLRADHVWPSLVEAGKQGVRVIEPLIEINRLSEAGPALLQGDVSVENIRANGEGLLAAFPLEAEPHVLTQLEKGDVNAVDALLFLALTTTNFAHSAFNTEKKMFLGSILSSNEDRRRVLGRLMVKAQLVLQDNPSGDSPLLFQALLGDKQLIEQLASRDASTLTKDEVGLIGAIVMLYSEPRLENLLVASIDRFEDEEGATILGYKGYLASNDNNPKLAELPAKLLAKILVNSPRYGKGWLVAYITATNRAQVINSSRALLAAAITRKWTIEGVEQQPFLQAIKSLKLETEVFSPEAYWLIVDVLKELGLTAEALQWVNEVLGNGRYQISHATSLYLQWQQVELLWRSGQNSDALAAIQKLERETIPKLNAQEKYWSPKPIDAYTQMLKGGILNALGRKAEAVRVLYDAEDRLTSVSTDEDARLKALIQSYRAAAQRESAKADVSAALGYFEQENRKDTSRLQQDAEELALETQIKFSLGDGNYEEAHRLTERLALRRFSAQSGGVVASRSPERQAALDNIQQLRQRIREVEEQIRQAAPSKGEYGWKDQSSATAMKGESGVPVEAQLAELRKQRAAAQRKLKEYFVSLKANHPEIASLVGAEPVELGRLQKLLTPMQVLVQYLFLKGRGWAFVAKYDGIDIIELAAGSDDVSNAVNHYRRALQQSSAARGRRQVPVATASADEGQWLSKTLIQPLQAYLEGVQHLIVIPHGDLHSLPFATLRYRNGYLIENFAISQLPSASHWSMVSEGDGNRGGRLLALGNPIPLSPEWTPLPGAESEVRSITTKFSANAVEAYFGKEVTRRRLMDQSLANASIHLALHGEAGNIDNTRLVLSDGYLGVKEIWGLAMDNSPMVVLSACETALGEHLPGDEVTSLTNGFMFAGAKSVVGSLWKVPDEATKLLMENFYDSLLQGKTPASALVFAQRQLHQAGHPPMDWGAFIVAGK